VLPAVDGDVGAGHEGCLVRGEVNAEPRDFVGLAQALIGIGGRIFETSTSFGIANTIFYLP
jgi:hypothetical protein